MIMKRLIFFLFGCLTQLATIYSQDPGWINGSVKDSKTGEPLPGAHVFINETTGVMSARSGNFLMALNPGDYNVQFQFVGYQTVVKPITLNTGDTLILHILLFPQVEFLNEVVVSAEKFKQKLSDVNVSMAILKPERIIRNNAVSLEDILTQLSGVEVLDGQPSIRGGSGYSYGAGSRVLVVVDGLPLMSGDAGDVKWDFLPLENLSQIEIIKGASSVLYGSSAMNGVINLRYRGPGIEPETMIQMFSGGYMQPRRKELIWWDSPRWYAGLSFSHSRKIKNIDLVTAANLFQDIGYREDEYEKRARINLNLNYRSVSVQGLSYGLNTSGMLHDKSDFFLWMDADSGAYRQNPAGTTPFKGYRLSLDPYVDFITKGGGKHTLKTRYFTNTNVMPDDPDKNNHFDLVLGEYRFHRKFKYDINWTLGISNNYSYVRSNLYGNHQSNETALFTQVNGNLLNRIKYTLGFRWESYSLDANRSNSQPVIRAGLNYKLFPNVHMRVSAGQGYRFPSIAEKYTAAQIGSINVFPNPELEPETGWSGEIGLMTGFQAKSWKGFVDMSLFWNEYKNMIEYTFGLYLPDTVQIPSFEYLGFKALNVGKARITGLEILIDAEKTLGEFRAHVQGGYSYIYPRDMNIPKSDSVNNILKYRFRHSAKGDIELSWKRWSTGTTLVYNSFMESVDSVFTDPLIGNIIMPGYPDYRERHTTGHLILDYRIACRLWPSVRLSLILKNLFNVEYMGRPGDIRPHRSFTFQIVINL